MTVAAEGNFTRAAQQLGVSQPAISQHIAELEKQLGTALFLRGRGNASLTPEGYVFREYAQKILHWYDAADALFGPKGSLTYDRPVRIAVTSYTASAFLPALMQDLVAMTSTTFIINTYPEDQFPEAVGADIYLYCYTREVLIDAEGDTALPFLRIYVNTAYEGDVYELAYERFEQQPFQSIDEYTSGPGLPKNGGLGYVGAYTNPNDEKDYEFLMTYFQDKKGIVEFRLETSLDTFDDMEFEFRDILSSIK